MARHILGVLSVGVVGVVLGVGVGVTVLFVPELLFPLVALDPPPPVRLFCRNLVLHHALT